MARGNTARLTPAQKRLIVLYHRRGEPVEAIVRQVGSYDVMVRAYLREKGLTPHANPGSRPKPKAGNLDADRAAILARMAFEDEPAAIPGGYRAR